MDRLREKTQRNKQRKIDSMMHNTLKIIKIEGKK